MQQGRGGIGSHKHGISGHATQSPRHRLMRKLAAERGEFGGAPAPRPKKLAFASVRDVLEADASVDSGPSPRPSPRKRGGGGSRAAGG
jgi:hypothetical protein